MLHPARVGTVAEWCKRAWPTAEALLEAGADLMVSSTIADDSGAPLFRVLPRELLRDRATHPLPAWFEGSGLAPLSRRDRRLVLALVRRVSRLRVRLHRGPVAARAPQ